MPALGTHPLATDVVFADQLLAGTFPRANDAGALEVNSLAGTVIDAGSALFNGTSALRANSNLSLTAPFAFAVQYNPGSGSSTGRLVSITWGDTNYIELHSTGAGAVRARIRSGGVAADSEITGGFPANTWTSVAFVVTATDIQVWLAGNFGTLVSRSGITLSGSDSYITLGALTRGGGATQDFLHAGARLRYAMLWQGATNGAMTDAKLDQWAADPNLPYTSGGGGGSVRAGAIYHTLIGGTR